MIAQLPISKQTSLVFSMLLPLKLTPMEGGCRAGVRVLTSSLKQSKVKVVAASRVIELNMRAVVPPDFQHQNKKQVAATSSRNC